MFITFSRATFRSAESATAARRSRDGSSGSVGSFRGMSSRCSGSPRGGGPWSTWVAVQWTARLAPQQGEAYLNQGAHWIHLRWGKVVYFHAYLDTQLVAEACRYMAERGIEEAAAEPITG